MAEHKDAIEGVMTAFQEFKSTNDARLAEIEKKGAADPLVTEKLTKIEATLASFEDINQKTTIAAKQAENAERELKALKEQMDRVELKAGRIGAGGEDEAKRRQAEYKATFDNYCRNTEAGVSADELKALREYKTLLAGDDTLGGYYVTPAEMATDIIKAVVLQSPVRSIARVTPIGAPSLKLPKRTGTFAATRVGEIAPRTETTGYTTGLVEINCPEMYAEVHISEQMIEDSMFDIQAEMQMEFAEQFAVKEGAEFVNGTGASNQAEGFLTSNQLATTNFSGSAAAITADGMINLFYTGLKTAYAKNANWVMNRQVLGSVRKLKDGEGDYIWQPGIQGNVPNTILGAPYVELPDMPLEGAGTYPIAVGDFFRGYRVVDRILISVLRDPYTQSGSGQILFRARKRVGGAVTLGEAIAKMQCHV